MRSAGTIAAVLAAGLVVPPTASTRPADARRAAPVPNVYGLTTANALVAFPADAPASATAPVAVTGLAAGFDLVGIDVRPATAQLYAVAQNASLGRLYRLDPVSGAATAIGGTFALGGTGVGVDVNPVADALRVTSSTANLRVNLTTGVATPDTPLAYDPAEALPGSPAALDVAYTDVTPDASATTLYAVDRAQDALVTVDPPNTGTVRTVRPLGFTADQGGIDLAPFSTVALAVLRPTGGAPGLYKLDLAPGAASPAAQLVGALGPAAGAGQVEDLAIALPPTTLAFASGTVAVPEDGGPATLTVVRDPGYGRAVDVTVTTANGTASAPGDYTSTSQTLSFAAGESVATLNVPILNDTDYEGPSEAFTVALSAPTGGASVGVPGTATVTIVEDEPPPTQTTTVTTTTPAPPPVTVTQTTPAPPPTTVTTTTPGPTTTVPGPTTTVTGPTTTVTLPGTSPPPPDITAPKLTLDVADRVTPAALRAARGLRVTLACSEACRFSGTITGNGRPKGTVATFAGRRTASGRVILAIVFARKARGALRSGARGTLTTTVVASDAAGNRSRAVQTTAIGRPPAPDTSGTTGGGSG